MRRICLAILATVTLSSAQAAPPGFGEAKRAFESALDAKARQIVQVWLIAGGYSNVVPSEHFSLATFKAIQRFEAENGFAPDGRLDTRQGERLIAIADAKFAMWGFRKVTLAERAATVWVPFGLGLVPIKRGGGTHYEDERGRVQLDLLLFPRSDVAADYRATVADKERQRWQIHYKVLSDAEGWFVLSTTSPDGHDHYYRYHQDGGAVVGFALEWNNDAGNVNAERIAVLDSAVLGASMKGAPFIDPPDERSETSRSETERGEARAKPAPPERQPATRTVEPPSTPPKEGFSTGSGFFVDADGHFVTNAHVVKDCAAVAVKADDGAVTKARVVATDDTNDLALLSLATTPARVATLRIGARLGEGVEAFGFPHTDVLSTAGNFTLGNITALAGLHDDSRYLQMSAPVQAGNSGGPLLDGSGNLVGVVSAKLDAIKMAAASDDLPQNVNFAVKSAMLATFLDANRVTYKVGAPAAKALAPADIADQARAMSGFVVCR